MTKRVVKPELTKAQIKKVKWINAPKKNDAIKVGRFQDYWILCQNEKKSSYLIYDQAEWDAFTSGVKKHEFDDLIEV